MVINFIKKNWIILSLVALLLVLAYVFKPNIGKSLYKYLKDDYEQKDKEISNEIDSIQRLRDSDLISYKDQLKDRQEAIERINEQLEKAKIKIRQNEKLINEYRSGNFSERFSKFSELITDKDHIQR